MKKRALTLIEVMIVIFLITLITGAIGYNMKGSMDKGRKFKTLQAKEQLHDLLLICLDEGRDADQLAARPERYLRESGLAKDPANLVKDGWGAPFVITVLPGKKDFRIISVNLPENN